MTFLTPISSVVSLPKLPFGACPSTVPELVDSLFRNLMFSLQTDLNPGFVVVGETVPSVGQRWSPWLRTNGDALDGLYTWSGEMRGWVRPNPWPTGSRILIECSKEELKTVDGGDIYTPGPASGPMWEIDSEYDGKTPVGPDAEDYLAGENGGKGSEVLAANMMPKHQHYMTGKGHRIGRGRTLEMRNGPQEPTWLTGANLSSLAENEKWTVPEYADKEFDLSIGNDLGLDDELSGGVNNAMPITHPVRGVYVCKRTARRFYKVTE